MPASAASALQSFNLTGLLLCMAGSVTANLKDINDRVEASQATFQTVVGVLDAAAKRLRELQLEQQVSLLSSR